MTPLSKPSNASFMQYSLAFTSLQVQTQPSPIKEKKFHLHGPMDLETWTYIIRHVACWTPTLCAILLSHVHYMMPTPNTYLQEEMNIELRKLTYSTQKCHKPSVYTSMLNNPTLP